MRIISKMTGELYSEKYEWGQSEFWREKVEKLLKKYKLNNLKFEDVKDILIGNAEYPINIIKFEKLELFCEETSTPYWISKQNKIHVETLLFEEELEHLKGYTKQGIEGIKELVIEYPMIFAEVKEWLLLGVNPNDIIRIISNRFKV